MKLLGKASFALLGLLFAPPGSAWAIPTLQLDILGGYYDNSEDVETIMAAGSAFTLYAYLTPGEDASENDITALLNDTFYLSAALVPKSGPGEVAFGSFDLNGVTYEADDLDYGTPPVEVVKESLNVPSHGIFPTFYLEQEFEFKPDQTASPYNTQENTGSGPDVTGSGMYFVAFDFDVSGLDYPFSLHFDLYNTDVKNRSNNICVNDFAPFSHDAESVPIPEPATMLLFGTGLAGLVGLKRRKTIG